MTMKRLAIAAAAILALSGCDPRDGMEQRTFTLQRMDDEDAMALLTPYIRDGALSGRGNLITVREEPERLEQIAELLERYDGPPAGLRVHVYVLEAGDFEGSSGLPAEATLRELLPFRGYRLLDDASFSTVERTNFSRHGGAFAIEGAILSVLEEGGEAGPVIDIMVEGRNPEEQGGRISSTVQAPFGETVVVASHRGGAPGHTLIVALRAERAGPAGPPASPASAAGP